MIITRSEEHRKAFSWNVSVLFLLLVFFFSKNPSEETFYYEFVEMAGYLLIILATLGRMWCALYITGRKNKELCQDGPYSTCRNPSYLFSFLGVIGISIGTKNVSLLLIVIPVFWGYYYFIIKSEEARLLELFGEDYTDYCSRVNRLVPNLKNYWSKSTIEINPQVATKSIIDAGWFLWFLIILEILEHLKA